MTKNRNQKRKKNKRIKKALKIQKLEEIDAINKAFKCGFCDKILVKPVFLPCGHSICKIHEEEIRISYQKEETTCSICSTPFEIPTNGLIPNKALEELIELNFQSVNTVYGLAVEECQKLDELYKRLFLLNDSYIHEKINEHISKIDLQREQAKMKIDEKALKVIEHYNEFEKDCRQNFTASLNQEHERQMKYWEEEIKKLKSMLLSNERNKCKKVVNEAKFKISKLSVEINDFEQRLFLNRLNDLNMVGLFTRYINGDMLKNNVLSIKAEKLSQYKNEDKEFFEFLSAPIEVIGIKWQMLVKIQKIDNEMCISIFLKAYSITNDLKITNDLVILCPSDSTKSFKIEKIIINFKKCDTLFWGGINLMKLQDLMNNKDLYDTQSDSFTAQIVIHSIERI